MKSQQKKRLQLKEKVNRRPLLKVILLMKQLPKRPLKKRLLLRVNQPLLKKLL